MMARVRRKRNAGKNLLLGQSRSLSLQLPDLIPGGLDGAVGWAGCRSRSLVFVIRFFTVWVRPPWPRNAQRCRRGAAARPRPGGSAPPSTISTPTPHFEVHFDSPTPGLAAAGGAFGCFLFIELTKIAPGRVLSDQIAESHGGSGRRVLTCCQRAGKKRRTVQECGWGCQRWDWRSSTALHPLRNS